MPSLRHARTVPAGFEGPDRQCEPEPGAAYAETVRMPSLPLYILPHAVPRLARTRAGCEAGIAFEREADAEYGFVRVVAVR